MRLSERVDLVASGASGMASSDLEDCNVYLLKTSAGGVLFDTGVGRDLEQLLASLARAGSPIDQVAAIFLTHTHYDHCAAAAKLTAITGTPLYASAESARRLAEADEEASGLSACKRAGIYPPDYRLDAATVSHIVGDGDTVAVGDAQIETIATPGHSADHTSYLVNYKDESLLFGGDLIYPGGKIGLTPLPDCSLQDYIMSLEKFRLRRVSALFAGHYAPTLTHASQHFDAALAVLDRLGIPQSA